MKSKSPFDRFAEESERIRKTPLTSEQIKKINDIFHEEEKEESEEENSFPLPKTAGPSGTEINSQT